MSRLRRRASARKRESRATVSRVQNPVPRVGLRETPVQRGVRQAVRRLSKVRRAFDSHHPHRAWGANGWNRANGRIARVGREPPPLPTKLNFSIFSSSPVDRDRLGTQCAASASASGAKRCATRTRYARASASAWRRAASAAGHGHAPHGRGGLGAPPERERPRAMRGGHRGQLTPRIRHARRRVVPKRARRPGIVVPAPRPRALRAGAGRRRVDGGAAAPEAGAGRARRGGQAAPAGGARHARADGRHPAIRDSTELVLPTVTCSTGRACSCASPWRRWATGTSRDALPGFGRGRSAAPRRGDGRFGGVTETTATRPRFSARVRRRFRRSLCTASAATATAGSRWSTRGTCGAPWRFCRTRKRAHDTAVRERYGKNVSVATTRARVIVELCLTIVGNAVTKARRCPGTSTYRIVVVTMIFGRGRKSGFGTFGLATDDLRPRSEIRLRHVRAQPLVCRRVTVPFSCRSSVSSEFRARARHAGGDGLDRAVLFRPA